MIPSGETERDEYLFNEQGVVFSGAEQNRQVMYWSYDQFDPVVLEVVFKLLEKIPFEDRQVSFQNTQSPLLFDRSVLRTL